MGNSDNTIYWLIAEKDTYVHLWKRKIYFLKYICQSTRVLFILENNVLKKKEHSIFFLIFYNIDSDL